MKSNIKNSQEIARKDKYILIITMFLPCFLINRNLDNDIWFLLNHGRYVLEHGFPIIEPFTIHQGFEFVMQQWLSACIFWVTYLNFGVLGLHSLVIVFYILSIYFIFKLCIKISNNNFFVSYSISICSSIFLRLFMVHRPYIFSTLIIILELYILESYIFSKKKKYLYFLPILSLLLVNLHSAMWPMLFIIIIPYIIDSFNFRIASMQSECFDKRPLILTIISMIIIAFLNPYGIDAMTYAFRSYGYFEINYIVGEMNPLDINTLHGKLYFCSILFVFLIYSFYKNGKSKIRYILLTLGIGYMALSSVRNFSLFAVCAFFPLAYYLKDFKLIVKEQETTKRTLFIRNILQFMIILIFILSISYVSNPKYYYKDYDLLNSTIEYMIHNKDKSEIVLYTGYNDGNLCEFKGIPSYLDTRAEVFVKKNNKKDDVMMEYYLLQTGKLFYKDFLNKYQFTDLIVTRYDTLYVNLKNDKDYRVWYTNSKYFIFEKKKTTRTQP